MRFIGNKEKVVPHIYRIMAALDIKGDVFCDLFAGTASVGRFFKKKGYSVYSCDMLYFSYCLQRAYIENNRTPQFTRLRNSISMEEEPLCSSPLEIVLNFLNKIKPAEGFIYKNYAPGGTMHLSQPRMYLSDENAKKIDAIRIEIENWQKQELLEDNEYFILLACLIESVSLFTNVSGVYGAFLKTWDLRALKPFKLSPVEIITSRHNNKAFCGDSLQMLAEIKTDILYLDPPYNARQYAPNYHLIETIAKYDAPQIYGITGMRPYNEQKSSFCKMETALRDLDKIAATVDYKYLLMSYNNEGIMQEDEIMYILTAYGDVRLLDFDYTRFKSHSHGKKHNKVTERLYILSI